MKKVNEIVDLGNYVSISINEFGGLVVSFDDTDIMFDIDLPAKDVYVHLKEFFDNES